MTTPTGDRVTKFLAIGVMVLAAGLLVYAYFYLLQWKEEEVDMGPTKEAMKNPFLAAEMYLNRQDIETEVTRQFSLLDDLELDGRQVGDQDTIIIISGRGAIKENRFEKLYQWVENGGTLVASTANPFIGLTAGDDALLEALELEVVRIEKDKEETPDEDKQNEEADTEDEPLQDERPDDSDPPAKSDPNKALEKLFEVMNQDRCDTDATLTSIEFEGVEEALEANFHSDNAITFYDREPNAWVSNDDGVMLTYHEVGDGYVYVTVDNHIWRNNRIQCFDHAYILWQLVNPEGKVWFVMNQDAPSLTAIIWATSPVAVISALLSLLLWLWKSGVRLGPLYYPRRVERRSFAEHIHANAVFLWRHEHQQTLIDQLKKDIVVKVVRRVRNFEELSEPEQLEQLEQISGLARTDIENAFFRPVEKNRGQFLFASKILKQIKDKL